MHYFDTSKKGLKFEHQQTKRKLPAKPVTPPQVRSTKPVQPLKLYSSLPEDHIKYWREEFFASSSTDSQARKDNVPSDNVRGEGRKDISQPDVWKTKPKGSNQFCIFHLGTICPYLYVKQKEDDFLFYI